MTNEQALKLLKKDGLSLTEAESEQFCKAYDTAVKAFELMSHITDRPCEACEFHGENGCREWECVFDEWFKAQYKARKEQNDRTL